jgi:hypothetical protein
MIDAQWAMFARHLMVRAMVQRSTVAIPVALECHGTRP